MNKENLINEYEKHYFNGDPEAMEILLSAVIANYMDGAPVWLLFIGASGAGKVPSLKCSMAMIAPYL